MVSYQFRFIPRILCSVFIGSFFWSCATKTQAPITAEKAAWETKAQLRNLKDQQVHNISIDVLAIKGEKLRLEAAATLGYRLASVVLDKEKVVAIVPPEKKIYAGAATQDVIAKALKIPLHPNVFFAMIFDQGLKGPGWTCTADEQGAVKQCQFKNSLTIQWERLVSPQKIVRIRTKTFEMDWMFKSLDMDWHPESRQFELLLPQNYQVVRL